MVEFEIKGLDEVLKHLEELRNAAQALDGDLVQVGFNPDNPQEVETAIRNLEVTVDKRISPYRHNESVLELAAITRKKFRDQILAKAEGARKSER